MAELQTYYANSDKRKRDEESSKIQTQDHSLLPDAPVSEFVEQFEKESILETPCPPNDSKDTSEPPDLTELKPVDDGVVTSSNQDNTNKSQSIPLLDEIGESVDESLVGKDAVTVISDQALSVTPVVIPAPPEKPPGVGIAQALHYQPPKTRKRSNSSTSQNQTEPKKVKVSPPKASKKSISPSKSSQKNVNETDKSSTASEDNGFNYFSLLFPTDVLPTKDHHLRQFLGKRFTDLEVPKNDPFKYGCVTDIVQLDGNGPYLFKFYNYMKFDKKPPPDNEEDWAYQGCDELIQDYHKKKNQIYLWH